MGFLEFPSAQPSPAAGPSQAAPALHSGTAAPAPSLSLLRGRAPFSPSANLLHMISRWQRATFYQPPSKTKLARCCSSRNWRGKAAVLFYNSISKFIQKKHPYNQGRFYVRSASPANRLVPLEGSPHRCGYSDVFLPMVALNQRGDTGSSSAHLLHLSLLLHLQILWVPPARTEKHGSETIPSPCSLSIKQTRSLPEPKMKGHICL